MSQSNHTERVAYIVSYTNKGILKRLNHLPVVISYHSPNNKQVLIYFDKKHLEFIETQLKKAKGFKEMEESALFQEEVYNF